MDKPSVWRAVVSSTDPRRTRDPGSHSSRPGSAMGYRLYDISTVVLPSNQNRHISGRSCVDGSGCKRERETDRKREKGAEIGGEKTAEPGGAPRGSIALVSLLWASDATEALLALPEKGGRGQHSNSNYTVLTVESWAEGKQIGAHSAKVIRQLYVKSYRATTLSHPLPSTPPPSILLRPWQKTPVSKPPPPLHSSPAHRGRRGRALTMSAYIHRKLFSQGKEMGTVCQQ
ncbi:hypothetical protein PAMA_021550 [Pampus argenteus]